MQNELLGFTNGVYLGGACRRGCFVPVHPYFGNEELALNGLAGDEQKRIVKEAIKEWLSEQAATFGWWSIKTLGSVILAALLILALWSQGWHK